MSGKIFKNRTQAGLALAEKFAGREFNDPVVLALPRGGVPVAVPVARALHAPLDLIMVKKIALPWQPEFAIGAVVDGEDPHIVITEEMSQIMRQRLDIDQLVAEKLAEIERRKLAYGVGHSPRILDRTAIVVDDGVAIGATMKAAIKALKAQGAVQIILAIPVASASTLKELAQDVDEVICLSQPKFFMAVGAHYADFRQVSDADVVDMIKEFKA